MLVIMIHNDGTGTNENANYTYTVGVNRTVLEQGTIKNHNRNEGWQKLVKLLLENSEKEHLINVYSNERTK